MATLRYWTGTSWEIVPTGTGGDGGGIQGPPGADGISIEVYGPQPTAPLNPRKGDQWLSNAALRDGDENTIALDPLPPPEPLFVHLLPDPPETVYIKYLD